MPVSGAGLGIAPAATNLFDCIHDFGRRGEASGPNDRRLQFARRAVGTAAGRRVGDDLEAALGRLGGGVGHVCGSV